MLFILMVLAESENRKRVKGHANQSNEAACKESKPDIKGQEHYFEEQQEDCIFPRK